MKKFVGVVLVAVVAVLALCLCACKSVDGADAHKHIYDREIAAEEYLKSAATCSSKALYFKSCECGEKGKATFEHGDVNVANHVGNTKTEVVYADEASHNVKALCGGCGAELSVSSEAHSGAFALGCPACGGHEHEHEFVDGKCSKCGCSKVAGLYQTGTNTLIYSWDELVKNGVLSADGSVVLGRADELAGDLVVSDSVTKLVFGAYRFADNLTGVYFGEDSQLKEIGGEAFWECDGLVSVSVPDGVTVIGRHAFWGCEQLENVSFGEDSQLKEIGDRAFYACESLATFTIPKSVSDIGIDVFDDCTSLESIFIPNAVENIKVGLFDDCSGLAGVVFAENSRVQIVGVLSFSDCVSLGDMALPDSVYWLASYAFRGCTNLKSVTFGTDSQLMIIGDEVFADCISLVNFIVPDNVTVVCDGVFKNCTALTSVTIGSGVRELGEALFAGCANLADVYFNGTIAEWNAKAFDLDLVFEGVDTSKITIHCTDGDITL